MRVEKQNEGIRLDAFLARMSGLTRSQAGRLAQRGLVRLNGRPPAKLGEKLREGDEVVWELPAPTPIEAQPVRMDIPIVYQDSDLAVVDKPRGLVVHPAAGHAQDTLVNALLYALDDLSGIGGALRPGIVHRLDKDTTGLMAVAKRDAAHLSLSGQIKSHRAGRVYLALVEGRLSQPSGEVCAPIGRSPKDRKRMAVVDGGREAVTHYRVVAEGPRATLLACRLVTGRTHQIRVHMRSLGHPVCGDPLYGFAKSPLGPAPLMLHAWRLRLAQPTTGEALSLCAPPPEDFMQALARAVPGVRLPDEAWVEAAFPGWRAGLPRDALE